ncbi:hypothetical protein FACS1894176_07420 [Bacteroidia bacterium]|nr:hypothetical protein FACS1894176_07420 [Bacteroidia bacterium]
MTGTNTFTNKVGGGILNITEKAVDGAFGVKDRILASFIPVVAGLTSNTFRRNGKEVEKPQYGKDAILVRNNKQGEVDLVKVDTNNRPLAGAKFVVKDANGKVIDSWETTDQPHKITGLNAGTYTIVETDPPAGHQLSDEAIELTVDGEGNVTKRKIERSQVPVTVEEKGEKDKGKPNNKEGDNNSKLTQMLEKGTKINEAEHTPLTKAIVGGNSTEVDRLSKSVDRVNEQLDNGLTPLMVASIQNHPDQNNLL